jgi:hypothetical protein
MCAGEEGGGMSTPYIGFGNDTLDKLPEAKAGDEITCPNCGEKHVLSDSKPPMMLFYSCGGKLYVGGMRGRLTLGVKPDASGRI